MHNPELKLAFDFVQFTNRNIFLTGKAGTGKTTFLHNLKNTLFKRMIVVAPTGVAAINAGGVTIHSFFQMPFGPILPGRLESSENKFVQKFNKKKINIIRSLDLLVIDEISMVRADLLDGIDTVLRRYKNKTLPFGGVQLLMIGDLQQLAPVVKDNEWSMLRNYYETVFFFSSAAFKQSNAISIELKHIYRQQDNSFIKILNEIRNDKLSAESIKTLNERYQPGFSPENDEGYITLTTHNANANRINEEQLKKVKAKTFTFEAEINGQFPEYSFPVNQFLELKVGAQVMFVKNDSSPEKRYYNGKIGIITDIDNDLIYVKSKDEEFSIEVGQEMWENVKYTINDKSKEIEEDVAGSFVQYPLRLAWAITIHKSQGLTFEKAVIDAKAAFAHGQTYVALSRCKTLEGLILSSKISEEGIICDQTVNKFNQGVEENQPDDKALHDSRKSYQLALLNELFSFRQIQYQIEKCKKIAIENATVLDGNLSEKLNELIVNGTMPLVKVADNFSIQLKQLARQENAEKQLQERISKAANYFCGQAQKTLFQPFGNCAFETDNKAIKKSINEVFLKIKELFGEKEACLGSCKKGFVLKEYLHIRAIAALQKPKLKTVTSKVIVSTTTENPALYEALKQWRSSIAKETGLAPYLIAHQKLLIGISNYLPGNENQLKAIKGMGAKKLKQYGEELLSIVQDYCSKKGISSNKEQIETIKKVPKKNTREISLELFKQGKTINEIASNREMATTTIEGHLAYFIGTGELMLKQFVEKNTAKIISDFFNKNPNAGLSAAKEKLDNSITYGELKFVRKHLDFMQQEKEAE